MHWVDQDFLETVLIRPFENDMAWINKILAGKGSDPVAFTEHLLSTVDRKDESVVFIAVTLPVYSADRFRKALRSHGISYAYK